MNRPLSLAAALAACALLAGCSPREACNLPTQRCGERCLDLTSDAQNCGACGQSCGTGTCSSGACSCPNGSSDHCPADPWPWCRDLTTDRAHCGDCATSCGLANETCSGGTCGCRGSSPVSCGSLCCAGTACCGGGTSCQTAHSNGLDATPFYDCTAPYSSTNPWTAAAAASAAEGWQAGTTFPLLCDGSCTGRQTSTSCAVWCYAGSLYAGKVTSLQSTSCTAVCNNFYGNVSVTNWQ